MDILAKVVEILEELGARDPLSLMVSLIAFSSQSLAV
jgi:hypothetical protein